MVSEQSGHLEKLSCCLCFNLPENILNGTKTYMNIYTDPTTWYWREFILQIYLYR